MSQQDHAVVHLFISDTNDGIHVIPCASRESAGGRMRDALSEYSLMTTDGMVPRFGPEEIEPCISAGSADQLALPNSDAYWIETSQIQP